MTIASQLDRTSSLPGDGIAPRRNGCSLRSPLLHTLFLKTALVAFFAIGPRSQAGAQATDATSPPPTRQQEAQPAEPPSVPTTEKSAPPKPAAQSTSSPSTFVDNASYVIGPEDNLQITVWREPTLSGVLPVRPDGMISLALLGDVKAAGFTPMQLGNEITQRLRKYIQDPSVTVAVTAVNSQRVFLVGEVNKVGPVPFTPDMTPLQAISTAGGPAPFANTKRIYILRGTGATQQKIPYNYKQALKGENKPGVTLQPGDTIVVP